MASPTFISLVEQLRESTGRALLDSGDYYGRGWERWQKLGDLDAAVAHAEAKPSAWADNQSITVNTVKHLDAILEYVPEADAYFEKWVEQDDEVRGTQNPWLVSAERFVSWLITGDPDEEPKHGLDVYNTYNGESLLDEVLQYVQFSSNDIYETEADGIELGEKYVLLATHNGADVRGGYGRPRVYKFLDSDYYIDDASISAWHSIEHPQEETLDLAVPERLDYHGFDFRGTEWTDHDGSFVIGEDAPGWDEEGNLVCPCGLALDIELQGV